MTKVLDGKLGSMGSTWQAGLGSLSVRATLDSYLISMIYILFNVACFAAGIAFIFLNGTVRVVGISLVVGGLFSFGTFMAQWWDHAWQRQNETSDRAFNFDYHDWRYAELQRLAKEYAKLYDKLEGLPEPPSQDNSAGILRTRSARPVSPSGDGVPRGSQTPTAACRSSRPG